MKKIMLYGLLLLACAGMAPSVRAIGQEATKPAPNPAKISAITMRGNKALKSDAIIAMSGHKVGEEFSQKILDEMKVNLVNSGYFGYFKEFGEGSVSVTAEQGKDGVITVAIEVSENPKIEKVLVTGTGPIKAADLIRLIRRPVVYNPTMFGPDVAAIEDVYSKAGYLASITPESGPDAAHPTILTVAILVTRITEIKVSGNTTVKTADILAQMKLKIGDYYNLKTLQSDCVRIYEKNAFYEVKPTLRDLGPGKIGVDLTITEMAPLALSPRHSKSACAANEKTVSHWDKKNALVVPFEYDPAKDNSPAVWLRINDSKPQLFIVDTGSYLPFMLDASRAATMQIVYPAKEVEVGGRKYSRLDGAKITWRFPATKTSAAKDVPLPLASLTGEPLLKNSIFITAETQGVIAANVGEYSAPVVGLIGGEFLRQAYGAVQFDFVRREMTLYPKNVPRLRVPGAATVPMHLQDVFNAIFVLAGNGSLHEMILDTGDAGSVVITDALAGEFSTLDITHTSGTGSIIGGTSESFQCLLPQLRIGSLIEKDIKAEREVKGLGLLLLGMNFFSRFRVTLDYAHNELTLERAANYLERSRAPGMVDFLVEIQNGAMRVTLIDPDGGAAKAGVKEGDILLEVNGMTTQKMTDAEAMRKMTGVKGETIKAVLQRPDGKKYAIAYQIRGIFDKRPKSREPQIGFNVSATSESKFFVSAVIPESPAQEAGLQAGDEILEVNGEKLTLEYMKSAAKRPRTKLAM